VDDPLQWILQRRKGNPRKKNSGWQDRSFCTTREVLLRCVREYCGSLTSRCSRNIIPMRSSRNEEAKLGRFWNVS
jgi:hypothetical protein